MILKYTTTFMSKVISFSIKAFISQNHANFIELSTSNLLGILCFTESQDSFESDYHGLMKRREGSIFFSRYK